MRRSHNQLIDRVVYAAMKRRTGHVGLGQAFDGSQGSSTVGNDPLCVSRYDASGRRRRPVEADAMIRVTAPDST